MSKKAKIILGIVAALLIGSMVIIMGIAICGIFSAIAIPQFVKTRDKAEQMQQMQNTTGESGTYKGEDSNDADIYGAKVLKSTLEGAMQQYEITEGKMPEKFSDFVLLYGVLEKPYTYSFADLEDQITKPNSPEDLDTTKLEVDFDNGVKANYTLNPPQIEMTIDKSDDQNPEINNDLINDINDKALINSDEPVDDKYDQDEYINAD